MATAMDEMRVRKGKIFIASLIILGVMVSIPFLFSVFVVPFGRMLSKQSISTKEKVEQVATLPPTVPSPIQTNQTVVIPETVVPAPVIIPLTPAQIKTIKDYIDAATKERYAGNFQLSLTNLQKALEIGPDYTSTHVAFAELYESFDDKPKAIDSWQNVLELETNKSSRVHTETLAKIDVLRKKLDEKGTDISGVPAEIPTGEGFVFVDNVDTQRDNSALFDERMLLKIQVGTKSAVKVIDPALVKIQVYFYDLLSNNQVVSTKARVKANFIDNYVDWADGPEFMQVVYEVPRGTWQKELNNSGISRNLYGYIIRIYYDNKLQDVYADPSQLAQLFPAKETLAP